MSIAKMKAMFELTAVLMGKGKGMDRLKESMEQMDKIPPYIIRPLLDAYMRGAVYVSSLKQAGGWEAVNAAWKSLPASVEQCLHPRRRKDKPTRFAPDAFPAPEVTSRRKFGRRSNSEPGNGVRSLIPITT